MCKNNLQNIIGNVLFFNFEDKMSEFRKRNKILACDNTKKYVKRAYHSKERQILVQNLSKCPVLSNGAFFLDVSLIFCAGKWIQLFTEAVLAFNLHFPQLRLKLQENQVHHSKEP
jgi:hypothetical protein